MQGGSEILPVHIVQTLLSNNACFASLIGNEVSLPMFTAALEALYAIWVWSKGVAFLRSFSGSDARVIEP